jgi:pyruvate formate lyase activating enzyme
MLIGGFQKLTVLDYPGKLACILFTYGCNYRCPFCHNAALVTDAREEHTVEEILSYIKKRSGVLEGVVVSGGEPFLQPDLEDLLREIKSLGLSVKLDTNGTFPDRLIAAVREGLVDYVAMDIKNAKKKYALTAGVDRTALDAIEQSVDFLKTDAVDYEFRTTLVSELHTEEDMREIGKWIKGAKRYFLQGFIDSGNLIGSSLTAVDPAETARFCEILKEFVPNTAIRGS